MKYKAKNDKEYNEHVKSEHISILHKNNKTKREKILFKHYIKKKKITDFIRFHFEEDFDIKEILTYEYTYLKFENCIFYKKTNNINSVVHTHSEFATVFACLQQDIFIFQL